MRTMKGLHGILYSCTSLGATSSDVEIFPEAEDGGGSTRKLTRIRGRRKQDRTTQRHLRNLPAGSTSRWIRPSVSSLWPHLSRAVRSRNARETMIACSHRIVRHLWSSKDFADAKVVCGKCGLLARLLASHDYSAVSGVAEFLCLFHRRPSQRKCGACVKKIGGHLQTEGTRSNNVNEDTYT